MTHEYTEEILAVRCPVCRTVARCPDRKKPHRERVWKAGGLHWYCLDCDSMVDRRHIVTISDELAKTGSCRALAETAA